MRLNCAVACLVPLLAGCSGSAVFTVENRLAVALKVEAMLDTEAVPGVRARGRSWLVEPGTVSTERLSVQARRGERAPPLDGVVELTPIALVGGAMPPPTLVVLREPGPYRIRVEGEPGALRVERLDGSGRPVLGQGIKVLEAPPIR